MENEVKNTSKLRDILKTISTILSWTVFALLIICAFLLMYYYISTRIYEAKGSGYEPTYSLYTIISPSMTPNINVYDVVIDLRVDNPEDIKINDVITFNSDNPALNGGTITHRVISITKDTEGNYLYQTKGDANLTEDSSPVRFDAIVGKVALRIPQLGRVQFFLASNFGWLILILIPALIIIVKDLVRVIKALKAGAYDNPDKPKDEPKLKESELKEVDVTTPNMESEPKPPEEVAPVVEEEEKTEVETNVNPVIDIPLDIIEEYNSFAIDSVSDSSNNILDNSSSLLDNNDNAPLLSEEEQPTLDNKETNNLQNPVPNPNKKKKKKKKKNNNLNQNNQQPNNPSTPSYFDDNADDDAVNLDDLPNLK